MVSMVGLLFLLFVVVPVVELVALFAVADQIGLLPAVASLLAVSFFGTWLVKREGIGVLRRMQLTVGRGEVPTDEVVDGGLLVVAGALCLVPGFVTDGLGLLLLVPPARGFARNRLIRRWADPGAGPGRVVDGRVVRVEHVGDVTPRRPSAPPTELGPGR
jgi:UPF0716 protein FxsA